MHRTRGFTLIEIAISLAIMMVILMLAIPSVRGVLADRRLQTSLSQMNAMVRSAQEHSVDERRPYLIVWQKDAVILRPEAIEKTDSDTPIAEVTLDKRHSFTLQLPAALEKDVPPQWIFWPSGTCEPAHVSYNGPDGSWEVDYAPLTALPTIARYAAQ